MGRTGGFVLKHRVTTLFRHVFRRKRRTATYRCLNPSRSIRVKPFSRLMSWTHRLRMKAKGILYGNLDTGRGYMRVGQEPGLEEPVDVPKGHMAVYVGQKEGNCRRILVPVVYINHPLFGNLLKESENEYGFNHPGGITIPCRMSEFEHVQTRIEAVRCARKLMSWKRKTIEV